MLTVNYDRKMGWLILTQNIDEQARDFKIDIDWCNGLCAFIYEYKNEKGEDMVKLMNFFADKTHVQNMIKNKVKLQIILVRFQCLTGIIIQKVGF